MSRPTRIDNNPGNHQRSYMNSVDHTGEIVSRMKVSAFILLVALALGGCTGPDHGRSASLRPHLPGIKDFLQGYVDAESTNYLNFFFVSPIRKDGGKTFAYAYWMTGNSIFILDLPIGKMENYFWHSYKARVDLAADVVPTPEEIGGSTYIVDAPWAENILRDTLRYGVKIVIKKNANPQARAAASRRWP